jgi:DNA-binding transcriptional LysR family regulator
MNFDQLYYFITVAEERNFSKAAKKLYITQPCLSQSISRLEQELNATLFFRTTNAVELTCAGEEFAKTAQHILLLKANCCSKITDINNSQAGRLSIVTSYFINAVITPIIIPPFSIEYPNIEINMIEIKYDQQEALLQKGVVDFAIFNGKVNNASIRYITLQKNDPILLILPPNHPSKKYSCPSEQGLSALPATLLSELHNERFILTPLGHRYRNIAQCFFEDHDIQPRQICTAANVLSAVNLVSKGYGISIAPLSAIRLAFFRPEPTCFLLDNYYDEPLYAAYHKNYSLTSAAKNFCSIAAQSLSGEIFT